ncbi:hypothetical protein PENSPDRAFT_680614 [Peniophora sp. CONT]|nr:hypothetical protein PENSPDRAFT_680614 [Peniophora sp. CONT]
MASAIAHPSAHWHPLGDGGVFYRRTPLYLYTLEPARSRHWTNASSRVHALFLGLSIPLPLDWKDECLVLLDEEVAYKITSNIRSEEMWNFRGKYQQDDGEPEGCPNPDCPVVCGIPGSLVDIYSTLRFFASKRHV